MKKLKLFYSSVLVVLFTACGTETSHNDNTPTRFDMWEYMTSSTDYKVEYRIYENNSTVDYEIENHRMYDEKYERDGKDGIITLTENSGTLLMVEPLQHVTIDRYLHIGDNNVFRGELIKSCSLKQYYRNYETRDMIFHNVLQVNCESKTGVKQEFYYGYNEGVVAIHKDNGVNKIELVKVNETRL